MSIEIQKFRAARWHLEIVTSLDTHRTINSFLNNPSILAAYQESHPLINFDKDQQITICEDKEIIDVFDDKFKQDIKISNHFYNRQMIVLSATYLELILKDFLTTVFQKYPERMYEFLYFQDKPEQKGLISLRDIIKSNSIEEILANCAEQASSNALKGKISSQLNNISKVIAIQFDIRLKNDIIELSQKRNRVVHENSQENVDFSDVEKALDICLTLLKILSIGAYKANIKLDEYHPYICNLDDQ